jgi:hypothetical protein
MVRVKHIGERYESNDEFIGRPSKWGNPFVIGKDGSRSMVLAKYAHFLYGNKELMDAARVELSGKNLVCYCSPKACHGDFLLEVANSADLSV